MKRYLLPLLLTLGPASAAAQDVTFVVATSAGASGSLCDPWQCAAAAVTARPGTAIRIQVGGGPSVAPILLVSAAPAVCVPVPGVFRSLIVRPDAVALPLPLGWGRIHVSGPGVQPCIGWLGTTDVPIPVASPTGLDVVLQVLAPVAGQPTLSNGVLLRIR